MSNQVEEEEWDEDYDEEEDEDDWDDEWEATMGGNQQEDLEDSDDDTEYPIDFDSHEPFTETEFEPDFIPMSYFAKLKITCAKNPDDVAEVLNTMIRSAKIPYQGMGNVFAGHPLMGARQMARYVYGYSTFVSTDTPDFLPSDPDHGTFLAKLSSGMTLRMNGKASKDFRKCLVTGDVKEFIEIIKNQIVSGLDRKKIIGCVEREDCEFEIIGFQAVAMQWPDNNPEKLKKAEVKIDRKGMSECSVEDVIRNKDLTNKILRKVYLDSQEHLKQSMLHHNPFWA